MGDIKTKNSASIMDTEQGYLIKSRGNRCQRAFQEGTVYTQPPPLSNCSQQEEGGTRGGHIYIGRSMSEVFIYMYLAFQKGFAAA